MLTLRHERTTYLGTIYTVPYIALCRYVGEAERHVSVKTTVRVVLTMASTTPQHTDETLLDILETKGREVNVDLVLLEGELLKTRESLEIWSAHRIGQDEDCRQGKGHHVSHRP